MNVSNSLPVVDSLSGEKERAINFFKLLNASDDDINDIKVQSPKNQRIVQLRELPSQLQHDELSQLIQFDPAGYANLQRENKKNEGCIGMKLSSMSATSMVDSNTTSSIAVRSTTSAYSKLHHLPWENDIIWSVESSGCHSSSPFVSDCQVEQKESVQEMPSDEKVDPLTAQAEPSQQSRNDEYMTKRHNYRWEISTKMLHKNRQTRQSLISPLNIELLNGNWEQSISWNKQMLEEQCDVLIDSNDVGLIFMPESSIDIRPILRIPKRKVGAAEEKRAHLEKQAKEKKNRIDSVMGNLEFGSETAEGRLLTDAKKSKDTRVVTNLRNDPHSLPAIKLQMTKSELPDSRLRNFHRPFGKFKSMETFAMKGLPSDQNFNDPSTHSRLGSLIKKNSDLNPTNGTCFFLEYVEQHPPMVSNPGMVSKIQHYWRPGESAKFGSSAFASTSNRTPPSSHNGFAIDENSVIVLGDNDDTPFVGDIPPGRMVSTFNNKLFKAPIFRHKCSDGNLFLLARPSSKSLKKDCLGQAHFYISIVPNVFLAGQVEPQAEVPAPTSRSANDFIRPYMSFHILRLFKKANDRERLKIDDIQRAFPSQSSTAIRKRMKEVAIFERGGNDSGWWKKKSGHAKGEDYFRNMITPDAVCLYESMMSGHRKLMDIGLSRISSTSTIEVGNIIELMIKRLSIRKKKLESFAKVAMSNRSSESLAADILANDKFLSQLERKIRIARYIHERLLLTPWNLTNNYVECHLQGKGSGMLKLGGTGDPSGRGEGFSFVRVPQSRAKKKESEDGENAAVAAVAAVTGTTADLRKLKMKESGAVLRSLGVPEADIKKLKRWDRIHLVRDLSSRATAHGVAGSLAKFARGARKSLSSQQQEYRRKCDIIYERQLNVLSSDKTDFSSDEESEIDDLEELEKDLEDDILGAEESVKIGARGPKNLFSKGGGGLNRSKEVLAEREDAAEFRRLVEDMKGQVPNTSKSSIPENANPINAATETKPAEIPQEPQNEVALRNQRHAIKRIIRTVQKDGTESVEVRFITDEASVKIYKAEKFKYLRKTAGAIRRQKQSIKKKLAQSDARSEKRYMLELQELEKSEASNKSYQELLNMNETVPELHKVDQSEAVQCGHCGQRGHGKSSKKCPLYGKDLDDGDLADAVILSTDDPLKVKIKKTAVRDSSKCTVNLSMLQEGHRQHKAKQKKRKLLEAQEQADLYKRPSAISAKKRKKIRSPLAHLNGYFEKIMYHLSVTPTAMELSKILKSKEYQEKLAIFPEFSSVTLETISSKIAVFGFASTKDFLKDFDTLMKGAKKVSAKLENQDVAKLAAKIQSSAKKEISNFDIGGEVSYVEKLYSRSGGKAISLDRRASVATQYTQ